MSPKSPQRIFSVPINLMNVLFGRVRSIAELIGHMVSAGIAGLFFGRYCRQRQRIHNPKVESICSTRALLATVGRD